MEECFSPSIYERLGCYVYMLFDPAAVDPTIPFYVGKGTGNRVFQHARAATKSSAGSKLKTIHRIISEEKKQIQYVILRHGLTDDEAKLVESAVIDAFGMPRLTNEQKGGSARGIGIMDLSTIIGTYEGKKLSLNPEHFPALLININKLYRHGMSNMELLNATCSSWVIGRDRDEFRLVFSVAHGIIRQAFYVLEWFKPDPTSNRWAFNGEIASDCEQYIGCTVDTFKGGARWPVRRLRVQ